MYYLYNREETKIVGYKGLWCIHESNLERYLSLKDIKPKYIVETREEVNNIFIKNNLHREWGIENEES